MSVFNEYSVKLKVKTSQVARFVKSVRILKLSSCGRQTGFCRKFPVLIINFAVIHYLWHVFMYSTYHMSLLIRYIFVGDFQCEIRYRNSMLVFATVTVSQATSCNSLKLNGMFVEYGMQEDGFMAVCFLHWPVKKKKRFRKLILDMWLSGAGRREVNLVKVINQGQKHSREVLVIAGVSAWLLRRTDWKRPWCWERLRAGGEGDDRG